MGEWVTGIRTPISGGAVARSARSGCSISAHFSNRTASSQCRVGGAEGIRTAGPIAPTSRPTFWARSNEAALREYLNLSALSLALAASRAANSAELDNRAYD